MPETSEEQLKAIVLNMLLRRGCWGARYLPVDALAGWLGKRLQRDGKRVKKLIKELINQGYLIQHKKGEAVSLNPARAGEIVEAIDEALP